MGKDILIIVDMLNDFINPAGKLYFEKGQSVIAPILKLKAAFKAAGVACLYVCDAHPPDSKEFADWPPHCLVGSWGAGIIDELPAGPGDIALFKDSLTLFDDDCAERILGGLGVTHLYVVGVATEYCVQACALDAVARRFAATVVTDAVAGVDLAEGDAARALEAMERAGVAFATVEAVMAGLA